MTEAAKAPPKPVASLPPGAGNIPLRLRRRRDGSLALTDRWGAIDSDQLEFPPEHLFPYSWLVKSTSVARLDGDVVHVELVNARATYDVAEVEPRWMPPGGGEEVAIQGVLCRLGSTEFFDPPPIDQEKARVIQVQRKAKAEIEADIAETRRVAAEKAGDLVAAAKALAQVNGHRADATNAEFRLATEFAGGEG